MAKIYSVVIEERVETIALVGAENIREAWEKAKKGDYDLLPNTAQPLPNRIRRVTLSDLIPKGKIFS